MGNNTSNYTSKNQLVSEVELKEENFDARKKILDILFNKDLLIGGDKANIIDDEVFILDIHIKAHPGTGTGNKRINTGYFVITMYNIKIKAPFLKIFNDIIKEKNLNLFELLFKIASHVCDGFLSYYILYSLIRDKKWTKTYQKIFEIVYNYDKNVGNKKSDQYGYTLVHWAARMGNIEALEWLYHHEACLNVRDNYGRNPINYAYDNKHKLCVTFLVCYTTFTLFDPCETIDYIPENDITVSS